MSEISAEDVRRIRATPHFSNTDDLRARGFEAGTTVYGSTPQFTVEDMKAAVFGTTSNDPKTLPIQLDDTTTVQVAVSLVRTTFSKYPVSKHELDETDFLAKESDVYCDNPDWYIEGWVVDARAVYGHRPMRVRAYVFSGSPSPEIRAEMMDVQIIPENPDPNGQIGYVSSDD